MIRGGAFALAALAAFAGTAAAQTCKRCGDKGVLPCAKHPKGAAKLEENAIFCSIASRCTACMGALEVDCPDCHLGEEQALLDQRADLEQRCAAQLAFEKEMGGAQRATIVTPHFQLTFEVESLTVGRKPMDQHELLHLYAQRLEKLFADFGDLLKVKPRDFVTTRYRVFVWRSPLDQKEASLRYAKQSSPTGVKLMGAGGVYTLARDKGIHAQDADLHRTLVHNVTHLLTSSLFDGIWLGERKSAWLDEGLAHWFEDKGFGECTNFCYQESNANVAFRGGKWRAPVRVMAETGKRPPFAETSSKSTEELTTEEHALSFSYVDFLLEKKATSLPALIRALQKKKPLREALDESYGIKVTEFDDVWTKWVVEAYAKK